MGVDVLLYGPNYMGKMVQNRVRTGSYLSSTLFQIYIERIMSDALEEHDREVSISSRNTINLQFVEDIDAIAEEDQEQETLVESLNRTCTRYKMEISAEKIKLMTNSSNAIQTEIKVKGQKLGTITIFSEQLFLIMAQNLRFSQGLPKPLQLL